MEKMMPAERVAYAHGRIARDMQDFQRQIDSSQRTIIRERNLWLALVVLSTVMLMIVFYLSGPNQLIDYILIAVVFSTFTIIRFVSYGMIKRHIATMEWLQNLYSRLANDETLNFGFETMKVESNGEAAKKIKLAAIGGADMNLHNNLVAALRVLSALVAEIEMEKDAGESIGKSDDAA